MIRLLLILIIMSFYVTPGSKVTIPDSLPTLNTYSPPSSNTTNKSWVGSAIMAGASLLGGLFGNKSQNNNINAQIKAQAEENQKNREYNLMLAQKQNAWNVEQWERENAYNDPSAQLARMQKAGINPDMAVGGGYSNTAASSPAMTSGAASTAQDMSALGQRPTIGQAIQLALRDSMIGAQIDNIKANTEKTRADTEGRTMENDVQRELKDFLGLEIKDVDTVNHYYFSPQAQEYLYKLRQLKSDAYLKNNEEYHSDVTRVLRELNYDMEKKISSREWELLSDKIDMSIQDAKEFIENAALRLRGLKADVSLKESEAKWNSTEILDKLPDGLPLIVKFLRLLLGK